jgi:hypothetical protein
MDQTGNNPENAFTKRWNHPQLDGQHSPSIDFASQSRDLVLVQASNSATFPTQRQGFTDELGPSFDIENVYMEPTDDEMELGQAGHWSTGRLNNIDTLHDMWIISRQYMAWAHYIVSIALSPSQNLRALVQVETSNSIVFATPKCD